MRQPLEPLFTAAASRNEEVVSVAGGAVKARATLHCVACAKVIGGKVAFAPTEEVQDDAPLYCEDCRTSSLGPPCRSCGKPAPRSDALVALDMHFHRACLKCEEPGCGKRLPEEYYEWEGSLRCREHYLLHAAERCAHCDKPVNGGLRALGRAWHRECLTCKVSGEVLGEGTFYLHEGGTLSAASLRETAALCHACGEPALQARIFAMGNVYHHACFRCACCHAEIGERRFVTYDGEPYLEGCYQKLFGALSGEMQELVQGDTQSYGVHVPLSMQLGQAGLAAFAAKHAELFPAVKRHLRERGVTAAQAFLFQPPFVTKPVLALTQALTLTLPASLDARESLPELLKEERQTQHGQSAVLGGADRTKQTQQWEQLIAGVHDVSASKGNPWWATLVPELSAALDG